MSKRPKMKIMKISACIGCPNVHLHSVGHYSCWEMTKSLESIDVTSHTPDWCPLSEFAIPNFITEGFFVEALNKILEIEAEHDGGGEYPTWFTDNELDRTTYWSNMRRAIEDLLGGMTPKFETMNLDDALTMAYEDLRDLSPFDGNKLASIITLISGRGARYNPETDLIELEPEG